MPDVTTDKTHYPSLVRATEFIQHVILISTIGKHHNAYTKVS